MINFPFVFLSLIPVQVLLHEIANDPVVLGGILDHILSGLGMLSSEAIQIEVEVEVIGEVLPSEEIREGPFVLLLDVVEFNVHGANLIITNLCSRNSFLTNRGNFNISHALNNIPDYWWQIFFQNAAFTNYEWDKIRYYNKLMKQVSAIGKKLVEDTFFKQRMLVHLGSRINNISSGEVELFLPKTELALQHHGFIHGGIITTLADTAAGLACFSLLDDPSHACITVELKINFIKPADSDIISVGKVMKQNKSLMVSTAEILNKDGKICAFMLQTVKRVRPGDLVKNQ